MKILFIFFFIIGIIEVIYEIIKNNKKINSETTKSKNITYNKKNFMTNNEYYFYYILKELENEMNIIIHPQINLATIIEKENFKYRNELFRNIDFAIFTKDYKKLLLLIEINDNTHKQKSRKIRDKKVKEICKNSNIRLIFFYTDMKNEKEYIKNRIRKIINEI